MGLCHGKPIENPETKPENPIIPAENEPLPRSQAGKTSSFPFYSPSPLPSLFKNSPANSSVSSTPLRLFKRPFPPPSPAKHIRALLARRHGSVKPNEASIPEGNECEVALDKNFGFLKQFVAHYELGEEVGRGHFGYTCSAKGRKGSLKGQDVAVKVIPKSKVCFYVTLLFFHLLHVTLFICLSNDVKCNVIIESFLFLGAYIYLWKKFVENYLKLISCWDCSKF